MCIVPLTEIALQQIRRLSFVNRYGGYIAAPGFDIQSVKIDGMNISYMDRPAKDDNQPTLVFIHGITGQKLGWIPLLRQLPSSWRIVALDLPGHGESDFSEDLTYCVDFFVEILHKVSEMLAIHYLCQLLSQLVVDIITVADRLCLWTDLVTRLT